MALKGLREQQAGLQKEVSFHERQLDVTLNKQSGIVHLRGSERRDLRTNSKYQYRVYDDAVYAALSGIVDSVARMRKVNRGFSH